MKPLLQACSLSGTRASAFTGARPYVSTGDVNGHTISPSVVVTFDDRPSRADLVAEDGDILFARMQATDKVVLVNVEKSTYIWSTGFAVLRPREGISSRWVEYWLKSPMFQEKKNALCTGATQKAITNESIRELSIPIPPLSEQKRIVKVLDEADQLRRMRAEADKRTAKLIPGLFHEMFGDPLSKPNSKGWANSTLGDLGTVVTGNTPPRSDSSFYGDFIEWVKTDNIDPIRGTVEVSAERLSESGALRGRVVPEGSILVTCITGSIEHIGDSAIVDRKVAINQQINAIVHRKDIASGFLGSLVCALKPLIQANTTGVMTRIINKTGLEGIPAIAPPYILQREFTDRIAEIRTFEDAQMASRQRLDNLFQSLLHRAFRGKL